MEEPADTDAIHERVVGKDRERDRDLVPLRNFSVHEAELLLDPVAAPDEVGNGKVCVGPGHRDGRVGKPGIAGGEEEA